MKIENSLSRLTDRQRWAMIIAEMAACFVLIYVAALYGWPKHEYLRFVMMAPLYQAGVWFGFSGGAIGGIIASLVFIPLVTIDPLVQGETYGTASLLVMILFIALFGVFAGGAIGNITKTQKHMRTVSKIFLSVVRETSERDVMLRLGDEAQRLIEAEYSTILLRDEAEKWRMFRLSANEAEPVAMSGFTSRHPLVWAADSGNVLATNSIVSDSRFAAYDAAGSITSLLTVPVTYEETVYGAVMLAGKKNQEHFSAKDLAMAQALAGVAGAAIYNKERERDRQEKQQREEQMKELFSRFVSSSVADHVLDNPELLDGRWETVTVLVSDIRDFTRISESMRPHELVAQLNDYFTSIVDIVFEHKGTIDKFIGDCIIAYWGAPVSDPDHAEHAVQAAMSMEEATRRLNSRWAAAGRSEFRSGIALHTCRVLLGNLGDDRKRAFTIMGAEVRKALEMESLCKTYGKTIILSGTTGEAVSGKLPVQKLPEHKDNPFGTLYHPEQV